MPAENSLTALFQISVQRRRSQIAQITSHSRCAREKQKSGAAVEIWRVSDPTKEIPFWSETRDLRFLSALADPHFALPEFCREQEACRADPGPVEISIDRSQKGGAEFYRCEISSRILKARPEKQGADPKRENLLSPFMRPQPTPRP